MSPSQKLLQKFPCLPIMTPKRLFRLRVWESVHKNLGTKVDYLNFIVVRRANVYDLRWKEYYDDASSFFDGDYDIGRK